VNPEQMKYNLSKKNYVNESQFFHLQMLQYTKDEKLLRTYANASELIQHGLFVTRINDSNLAKVLSVNDIILEIQGQKIETIQDFDKILGSSLKKNEKYIILLIVRNGKTYSKAIELREVSIKE
jgi:PDZ domain-containing secreted protein